MACNDVMVIDVAFAILFLYMCKWSLQYAVRNVRQLLAHLKKKPVTNYYIWFDTADESPKQQSIVVECPPGIELPKQKTEGSIGYDLLAAEDVAVQPGTFQHIKTGYKVKLPKGVYANLRQKSRHFKFPVVFNNGLIDTDYRGELGLCVHNMGKDVFTINKGEELCQLEFVSQVPTVLEMGKVDANTERNVTGFGGIDTTTL